LDLIPVRRPVYHVFAQFNFQSVYIHPPKQTESMRLSHFVSQRALLFCTGNRTMLSPHSSNIQYFSYYKTDNNVISYS